MRQLRSSRPKATRATHSPLAPPGNSTDRCVAPDTSSLALIVAPALSKSPGLPIPVPTRRTRTVLSPSSTNVSKRAAASPLNRQARAPSITVFDAESGRWFRRSEEHTSELQSLMRISYAVFCLKQKKQHNKNISLQTNRYYSHYT